MGLVGQAIQKCGGESRFAKNLGPVGKAQVGRNDHRPPFVPFRQHLEEQVGAFFGEGDISQFIEDEQTIARLALDDAAQGEPLAGLQEFVAQTAAGDKAGGNTPAAGLHSQAGGQVGFARAAFAQKDDVARLADIVSRGQLVQQTPI